MYTNITIEKWKFLVKICIFYVIQITYLLLEDKWWAVNEDCLLCIGDQSYDINDGGKGFGAL